MVSAEDTNETVLTDSSSDTAFIQNAINSASDGDTIDLGENKEYNLKNDTINVNKKVTIKGKNVTITAGATDGALSIRSMSDVAVDGISFINPVDLPGYGGKLNGKAIYTQSSSNIKISNCRFINYAYGVEMYSTTNSEVVNSYFNGTTTSISGMSGTGTKAIQLMGSKNINIKNNIFEGQIYDALSIASGSGYAYIEGNTFINNSFAIFYGGASTEGNRIKNNRFINCGAIHETYSYSYTINGKTYAGDARIDIDSLPVIGLQKASSSIEITGNEFTVNNNAMIIYSEAENTDHGFPSVIGGVIITNNTVLKASSDVDPSSITFYKILAVSSLGLNPADDITLKNNNFTDVEGINRLTLEFGAITDDGENITIPKSGTKSITNLKIIYVKDGRAVLELIDSDNLAVIGETITYSINSGSTQSQVSDEYGHIYINGLSGDVKLSANYAGSESYTRSSLTAELQFVAKTASTAPAPVKSKQTTKLTIAKKTFKVKAKTKKVTATLKVGSKAIKGKKITFKVGSKTYSAKTNSKGVATVKVKLTKKGTYTYTAKFAGDSTYKAVSKSNKIIVK